MNLKQQLFDNCTSYVEEKITLIQTAISNAQMASNSETKSTAGDKHDTARAMMQLEVEKLSKQLSEAKKLKITLANINPEMNHQIIQLGSIVMTSSGNYFISISAGKLLVNDTVWFAISPISPIAKSMIGLKEDERFEFNGKTFVINEVG